MGSSKPSNSRTAIPDSKPGPFRSSLTDHVTADRLVIALLLLVHVVATLIFLPPGEVLRDTPLHAVDYPVHTHRVHLYREALRESGVPWGYDPALSAGMTMNPGQDVGAKPLEVAGVLLPFLSPGAVVRLFLFLAVLCFPLWMILGCRSSGIPERFWPWILLVLVAPAWLDYRIYGFWHWGLVAFTAAAFFAPYVLGRFLIYLQNPSPRAYFALVAAASMLFLLQLLGPVILVPALVVLALAYRPLGWLQRSALFAVPLVVAAVNLFWLGPLILAQNVPQPVGFSPVYPPDSTVHLQFSESSILLSPFEHFHILGLIILAVCLAAYGLILARKMVDSTVAVALGITIAFGLAATLFGSDLPIVSRMQPVRFIVPTFVFMAIPVGLAIHSLLDRMRLSPRVAAVVTIAGLVAGAIVLDLPRPLDLPPSPDSFADFVAENTSPDDRLMIQSSDGHKWEGYESKSYPITLAREIIGSNFPASYDPVQFLNSMLLGRQIGDWDPDELRAALNRWGVDWVFTATRQADSLIALTLGPPVGEAGTLKAFRNLTSAGRFLSRKRQGRDESQRDSAHRRPT